MKDNVRFIYFGKTPDCRKHDGILTVAYQIIDIDNKKAIKAGLAFCSPKDVFNKKRGRLISTGRLHSKEPLLYKFENYTLNEDERPIDAVIKLFNNAQKKYDFCPAFWKKAHLNRQISNFVEFQK
jgi:hypothetical protein